MKKRILIVSEFLPVPPTDGIRIPIYNYIREMSKRHDVSHLYAPRAGIPEQLQHIPESKRIVKDFWRVVADRPAKHAHWEYLNGTSPVFVPHMLDESACRAIFAGHDFDCIIATSFRTCAFVPAIVASLPARTDRRVVAAINDALGLTFAENMRRAVSFQGGASFPYRLKYAFRYLRLPRVIKYEREWLQSFTHVLVQTRRDKAWLRRIAPEGRAENVLVCGNCPNATLLELPLPRNVHKIGFIGALYHSNHGTLAKWGIERLLPEVQAVLPDACLFIAGRRGPKKLMTRIHSTPDVQYEEFTADLRDLYRSLSVAVFCRKSRTGIVNRVLECMAAGVVVIGDRDVFNGICGFRHGIHGFIVRDLREVPQLTIALLEDAERRDRVATAARSLIEGSFRWHRRIEQLESSLQLESCRPCSTRAPAA